LTAEERLALVLAKVDRARKHFEELSAALVAYRESKPGKIVPRRDPDTRRMTYVLESIESLPAGLASVVGDVLQNLRSALDHLAYQLVLVGTGKDASEDAIYFPIANDAQRFAQLVKGGQVHGARPEAVAAIEAVQPYKVGNDLLTQLHRLNIIDKHRALLLVGSSYQAMDVMPKLKQIAKAADIAMPPFGPLWLQPADKLFPMKAGAVLYVDEPDAEPDPKIQFLFDVELSEPAVVRGHMPLLKTVKSVSTEVDRIVRSFLPLLQ